MSMACVLLSEGVTGGGGGGRGGGGGGGDMDPSELESSSFLSGVTSSLVPSELSLLLSTMSSSFSSSFTTMSFKVEQSDSTFDFF